MPLRLPFGALLSIVLTVTTTGCSDRASKPSPAPTASEASSQAPAGPDAIRAQLLAEFAAVYPLEAPASQSTRSYELEASPSPVQQFDGRSLNAWAYNGQVPGPTLRVRLGETLEVRLKNALPQPTTIHWHGVRVPNAMDGVPGVTQDPTQPGESFLYRFTPKDAGTFWFHPHVRGAEQVERGLYGVLIVEDREPKPYSREVVWVLDDWRLGPDGEVDPNFVTRGDLAHDGRWGQHIVVNGASNEELVVQAGERIRMRLVNPSNGRAYRPVFAGLPAKVIAVDGLYTASPIDLRTGNFELAPGNRLDLDLTFDPSLRGRTFPVTDQFGRKENPLATIFVTDEVVETPKFEAPRNPAVPKWAEASQLPVDVTYVLDARRGGPHGIEWTINGKTYGNHEITQLTPGRFVRVRFQNVSSRIHPMHIHGPFFKVIERNGLPADEPFFRDTVLLHRKETVDVGMVPIDWGKWMMHCHILEHAEAGMMTIVEVGEGGSKNADADK